MTKDDIQFLKELQSTMKYEDEYDNDYQAHPRFWAVMDYKKRTCWEENADETIIWSCYLEEETQLTEESIKNAIEEHELLDDHLLDDLLEEIDFDFDDSVLEFYQKYIDEDAYLVPQEEVSYIVPNTLFLTKEEAIRHIESNSHNYSSKVHTYAMTAFRSPKVEKLINILHNADFDSIQLKETTWLEIVKQKLKQVFTKEES